MDEFERAFIRWKDRQSWQLRKELFQDLEGWYDRYYIFQSNYRDQMKQASTLADMRAIWARVKWEKEREKNERPT